MANKKFYLGVIWFVLSLVISVSNDVITKYIGIRLHSVEVAFLRFLFSTLTLIPFIIYHGKESIKSELPLVHLARGTLLFLGISAWTYGLSVAQVTTATVVSFSIPLFVLILAIFFLQEKITWQKWLATAVGFVGILVTIDINNSNFQISNLIFIVAAVMFATIDILNKKFVLKETMLGMLFYSAIVTTLLALPGALYYWQQPSLEELVLFFILGAGANLILYCLLKAFALADATSLSPFRYLELIISSIFAYVIFEELPHNNTFIGAVIIIPATLFVLYSEKRQKTDE